MVSALAKELQEAREQQAAAAEILKVIASSPGDVQPVFDAIVVSAARLIGGFSAGVYRFVDDFVHLAATTTVSPAGDEVVRANFPRPIGDDHFKTVFGGEVVEFADTEDQPNARLKKVARVRGFRSIVYVPLKSARTSIGLIAVSRKTPGVFPAHHVELLQTFAEQAVIAIENARLFNETREALERQTATAEILKVIASSPSDVQPVFEAIASSANRLLGGFSSTVFLFNDGMAHLKAFTPTTREADEVLTSAFPRPIADVAPFQMTEAGEAVQISDTEAPTYQLREIARARGYRSMLFTPLMNKGTSIGFIAVTRLQVGTFADHHVQLLKTFADQAVIAIENVRLFDEVQARTHDLTEALTYQTGSANILNVIASSPTDVGPVLQAIVDSACELCTAHDAVLRLKAGDDLVFSAHRGPIPVVWTNWPITSRWTGGRSVIERRPIHVTDLLSSEGDEFPEGQARAREEGGHRTILSVPLLREGESIGVITLRRQEVNPFGDKQIALLQTFADQAVIALGNVRLFEEVQARTRELSESLQQQTATSDVLQIISSSPSDLAPVFDKMLENATRVCGAEFGALVLVEGGTPQRAALYNAPAAFAAGRRSKALQIHPKSAMAIAIRTGQVVQQEDLRNEPSYLERSQAAVELADLAGARTLVVVPMLRDEDVIGVITVYRQEVRLFADKQIDLLRNFASQAVIAIENARLFNETREALERQTATAEILKVIARSPSNVQPVFEAIADRSKRLIGGHSAAVYRFMDQTVELAAFTPVSPEADATLQEAFPTPLDNHPMFRLVRDGDSMQIHNTEDDEGYWAGARDIARARGFRSLILTPLLGDKGPIGLISATRAAPSTFSNHIVELLKTFADQAVIAIENTRLFNETQEALEQQTATADILKVIASSPDDVQPVFDAIAARSNQLVGGLSATVLTISDDAMHLRAFTPGSPQGDAALRSLFPMPLPAVPWRDAILRGETFRITDMENENPLPPPAVREMARLRGYRSLVIVPLMRDGKAIGTIGVTRVQPGAFADHHLQLLQTFADQAVIAISNVELFREVEQRTRELSQSLDDLRTTQDRLVQTEKLASLGQLTAGIAHEIKNPLNFVNNFSALSAELIDELDDLLKGAALTDKMQKEADELTTLLKQNLEKIVQHGKRADSIVKNMLLHSREGSTEHRSVQINALVEESLNLAYHGARAERVGFSITLKHDLDPKAGALDLYPQEMTRALLNLISNGFYAATKRKVEAGNGAFEPVLSAATRNLGNTVEIRIRDNGTGIPPKVKEKMFNPFFTTKPTGEGTGLGLSMTHDIIVKQHGGRIEVETELGEFTEFIITLPRDT
jgi:GAF domain-containing protein